MITSDMSPLRTNIIEAYALHARRSLVDRDNFYIELGKVLGNIPKQETTRIVGDFQCQADGKAPARDRNSRRTSA